jgi:hypothetical protein
MRTSSNLFVANLAMLDLVMMAQLPIFVANSLYQGQVMGKLGCDLFGALGGIAGMGAAVNNVAIAYDRYRLLWIQFLLYLLRGSHRVFYRQVSSRVFKAQNLQIF